MAGKKKKTKHKDIINKDIKFMTYSYNFESNNLEIMFVNCFIVELIFLEMSISRKSQRMMFNPYQHNGG